MDERFRKLEDAMDRTVDALDRIEGGEDLVRDGTVAGLLAEVLEAREGLRELGWEDHKAAQVAGEAAGGA